MLTWVFTIKHNIQLLWKNGGKEIVISERCTNIFKGTCGFLFNANIDLP